MADLNELVENMKMISVEEICNIFQDYTLASFVDALVAMYDDLKESQEKMSRNEIDISIESAETIDRLVTYFEDRLEIETLKTFLED